MRSVALMGSSPRARGRRPVQWGLVSRRRFIPARGATGWRLVSRSSIAGSSPRARGRVRTMPWFHPSSGFIPARGAALVPALAPVT